MLTFVALLLAVVGVGEFDFLLTFLLLFSPLYPALHFGWVLLFGFLLLDCFWFVALLLAFVASKI